MKLKFIIAFLCISCCQLTTLSQKQAHAPKSYYQPLLQTWCDGMLSLQINGGPDDGGIFSPSHQFVHGRCGDAVYPLLTMYRLTNKEKYKTAALKVFNWSETHVSQPDGSWVNEADGRNNWKGITCFSVIALGEALRHHGELLSASDKKRFTDRLRKGGDYILSSFTFETGDINYPMSATAALAVCWKVLGDQEYLLGAKNFVDFALKHFTENKLIWGEGVRGINDTTPKGLRPIDVPYNMEESLSNLALYGTLTNDQEVLDLVTTSMQAHLNWMLPDGGLDAGWCSRQYKWTYMGTMTGDGLAGGFALMADRDKRFADAAFRNLQLRQSNTHNGLLYGGADLYSRKIPAFTHLSFSNAKGLAAAIDAGLTRNQPASLPSDTAYGVREWPEANVLQVAVGPWRASITTNDIASSPKRGGHPMGGALSMLWHSKAGPVAVASMNDYKTYEATNMQKASADSGLFCLSPRLELIRNGNRYSNLYDSKATLRWLRKGDSVLVTIQGHLRDINGEELPGASSAFQIDYTFKPSSFQMAVQSAAKETKLIFPVISSAQEPAAFSGDQLTIQKASSKVSLKFNEPPLWSPTRVFNFIPGFEAIATENDLDNKGSAVVRIVIEPGSILSE